MRILWRLCLLFDQTSWLLMLAAWMLGTLAVISSVGLLAVSAYLISLAALHPDISALSVSIVGVRFLGIARSVCRYGERYVAHAAVFRMLGIIRTLTYEWLEAQATPFARRSGGRLLSLIANDVETLKEFYIRFLAPPLIALLTLVIVGVGCGLVNSGLALVLGAMFLLGGLCIPLAVQRLNANNGKQVVQLRSDFLAVFTDQLNGIIEITALGRRAAAMARLSAVCRQWEKRQDSSAWLSAGGEAASFLILQLGLVAVLYIAVLTVEQGHLPAIYVAVIVFAVQGSLEAVVPLANSARWYSECKAAGQRIFALAPQETAAAAALPSTASAATGLVLDRLSLTYESTAAKEEPVPDLAEVSLQLSSGSKTAVVGVSGAGKSSLAAAITGLVRCQTGYIYWQGEELAGVSAAERSRICSVVSQQPYIFNASLRDNLLLANPRADETMLQTVLAAVGLTSWIDSLPEGLATVAGQQGYALSGGQRQRLALARALLNPAPLLLLDEPFSQLDPAAATQLMQLVCSMAPQQTLLIITHRLLGLDNVDEIVVMEQGHIVERGRYEELLAQRGAFYRLLEWQKQMVLQEYYG